MKNAAGKSQVIWAIDPLDPETRPNEDAIQELKAWANSTGMPVQPVYVLNSPPSEYGDDDEVEVLSRHVTAAERAASSFPRTLGIDWTEAPVVLTEPTASVTTSVDRLIQYASMSGAEFIVLSSHGRAGVERFFLGSFAELVLCRAGIPVLFLSHGQHRDGFNPSKAIFATDFSSYSKAAYERFLRYADRCQVEVVLFHQVPLSPQVESLMTSAGTYLPEEYFEEQTAWAKEESERWVAQAKALGVSARAVISEKRGYPSDQIRETAMTEKAGMIAMASQSGPFTSFLLGSVARGVFRPHELPVWVCGPEFLKQQTRDSQAASPPARPLRAAASTQ